MAKAKAERSAVNAHVSALRSRLEKDAKDAEGAEGACGDRDLTVEEGETTTLSATSERFKPLYRTVRPQSIDEVRTLLGPAPGAFDDQAGCCTPGADVLRRRLVSVEDLRSEDPAIQRTAAGLSRLAAQEYVMGNHRAVAHWKGVLDEYVAVAKVKVVVALIQDITVYNQGTLGIAANTHAVYANRVRLYGTGRIVCGGPVSFNVQSFEGKLPIPTIIKTGAAAAVLKKMS